MSHTVMVEPVLPRAAHDYEIELTTAQDLAKGVWQNVPVPAYPELALKRGALVAALGGPGAGKSTLAVTAIDSAGGPALLVSVEEAAGPSLAARLVRSGVKRSDFLVCSRGTVDEIVALAKKHRVESIAIDSVQRAAWTPRDLRHLLLTLPSLRFAIGVSQTNSSGDIRGGRELAHEADVVVEVDALRWQVLKSRYQPVGVQGDVLRRVQSEAIHAVG